MDAEGRPRDRSMTPLTWWMTLQWPFVFVIIILVLSHRLLLLFLVHNYDFLFISSLSARHIWCSDTFFHGREGVGHDESSSPVGRCLIRNRPWLWLTDKVIITPLDNPPSPPGRLFFTLRRISDFYDFTPKYIITKLMFVYRGLPISLNLKNLYIHVQDTVECHQLHR